MNLHAAFFGLVLAFQLIFMFFEVFVALHQGCRTLNPISLVWLGAREWMCNGLSGMRLEIVELD